MMQQIHRANTRGVTSNNWLNSQHSFSFADYFHPERIGIGKLRVLNDDTVLPSNGFGLHSHANMEIISIPLIGSLFHKDNIGNEHIIKTGDVQIMSAGTGIRHSEHNPSENTAVNFLQLWILPKKSDIQPRYAQKTYDQSKIKNRFLPIVSSLKSHTAAVSINQDAIISLSTIDTGLTLNYFTQFDKSSCYFFVIDGHVNVYQEDLQKRDAIALSDVEDIKIKAKSNAKYCVLKHYNPLT